MRIIISGDFLTFLTELWVTGPSQMVVRFESNFDKDLDHITKRTLQDEFFCLLDSLIDRWTFEIYGPNGRQQVFDKIEAPALLEYVELTGRDESKLCNLIENRRREWGQYPEMMTKKGVGGFMYHFSKHISKLTNDGRLGTDLMEIYDYFGYEMRRIYTLLMLKQAEDAGI